MSTTISEFVQNIQSHFSENFTECDILWDNIIDERTLDEFVRINITPADFKNTTLGSYGHREMKTSFLVTVQIFVKPDSGRVRTDTIMQSIQEVMMAEDLNIWITPFGVSSVGLSDPSFWQTNVSFVANHFGVM